MKIEKINENKVRITLSIEELAQRQITLNELERDSLKAKKLFVELIEESNLESSFVIEHSQLFVEATTDNNEFFTITITKVDDIQENEKYDSLHNENYNNTEFINIFEFENFDIIDEMVSVYKLSKTFFGKNSLYSFNNKYYLIFSKYSVKNAKFTKTLAILNEFSLKSYQSELFEISLKEKCKLVISNKAIQTLIKL